MRIRRRWTTWVGAEPATEGVATGFRQRVPAPVKSKEEETIALKMRGEERRCEEG